MSNRILFVDDEANPNPQEFVPGSYLTYYETMLTNFGFTVDVAKNADEALELIDKHKSNPFGCLVVDLHMPIGRQVADGAEYGGVWLSKKLQQEYPKLAVVILTNVTDPEVIDQLEPLEVVKVILFKHVCLPSTLLKVVQKVIRGD
jgi:CheY-like chemotaxis protein